MRIELPFAEALALADAGPGIPPVVRSLGCSGSTITAVLDLDALPTGSFAMRLAFAAAGEVTVTARLAHFAAGIATFAITAHARGLAAHRLLPYLLSTVNDGVARSGLPAGLVEVQAEGDQPVVRVDVQQAVRSAAEGIVVTGLRIEDAVVIVDAAIGAVRRRAAEPEPEPRAD